MPAVLTEIVNGVCYLTLNRPEVLNAINETMIVELDRALDEAEANGDVSVVVIKGNGRAFSAGHDLNLTPKDGGGLFRGKTTDERFKYERSTYYRNTVRFLDFPKPIIAQVHGHCLAAALAMVACCDIVIAAQDAKFGDPTGRMGLANVQVLMLPWVIPACKAKEMLFTGDPIDADEAKQWGLANYVISNAEIDAFVRKLAERIALMPSNTLHLIKMSVNYALKVRGLHHALEYHFAVYELSYTTEDFLQSSGSGMNKRQDFKGWLKKREERFQGGSYSKRPK